MKKFTVVFKMADGTKSAPFEVEAFGFKSAITAAMALWKATRTSKETPVEVTVSGMAS